MQRNKQTLYKDAINGYKSMPSKGGCYSCSDKEVTDAVDYILATSKDATGVTIHQVAVKPAPQVDYNTGRKVYEAYCSTCHNQALFKAAKPSNSDIWQAKLDQGIEVLYHRTIKGYKGMPAKGGCNDCTNLEVIAAVKYLLQLSLPKANFSLW